MKDFFSGVFQKSSEYVGAHKIISLIILLVIVGGGYEIVHSFQSTSTPTQYVLGTVQKGTVLSSVTGTGQVSTTNQVNLQAQASGTVTYVGVQAGDTVKQGKLLVELDDRSAQKALRDAETNLQSAQLALQKLQEPPTTADVTTLKNDIANAKSSEDSAAETVKEAYTTLLNSSTIASASDGSSSQSAPTIIGNYQKGEAGQIVISFYQSGGNQYFSASSVPTDIVPNTLGTVSSTIPQPIADTGLYIEFPSNAHSGTWIITLPNKSAANYLANYTAYQNALTAQQKANADAEATITEDNDKLSTLYTPDPITIASQQLAITQAQNAVEDAKANLADYSIVAPFDGTIATMTATVGDIASGTLGTMITQQKIAQITLNEVDVSKIKIGDKATLTFDAISGLSITGKVAEIDTVGTVSQGVVNYTVKITFDTDDARIKPGMTVTADIVTAIEQDVLTVPASAIKTDSSGANYVLTFSPALTQKTPAAGSQGVTSVVPPIQTPVEIGISDGSSTEILSGLTEGQEIVSRTINSATKTTTSTTRTATSLLGGSAGGGTRALTGGGGGGFRPGN